VKTQSNIHKKALNSCSHIFMHKCSKVKSKKFQSSSNHHGAKYRVYIMLDKSLKKISVLRVGQKYFWNWLVELCSKIVLH